MRGAVYLRCSGRVSKHFDMATTGHLIDFQGRSQRKVVRATFTAELLGGCDTIDHGIVLCQALHHISTGKSSAKEGKELLDRWGLSNPHGPLSRCPRSLRVNYTSVPEDPRRPKCTHPLPIHPATTNGWRTLSPGLGGHARYAR